MKRILTLLLSLIPLLKGLCQESSIPDAHWKMAQAYLGQQKDFSGIVMLGEGGEIRQHQKDVR